MTTAPMQPMFLLIEMFAVIQLARFWFSLYRKGYFGLCVNAYTIAFLVDIAALILFASQLALAVKGLLGEPSNVLPYFVFGTFFVWALVNCGGRLEHDSATRTIAALNGIAKPASRIRA